jgi:phosphoadenosine phosphosulfate reductase
MTVTAALPELAARAARDLEGRPAEDVVRWAVEEFGDDLCLASSMQDAVLVHLVSTVRAGVPVIFLDTGYHFAETIGTRDAVASAYPVRLLNVTPKQTVAEQDEDYGPRLFERDPDLCCRLRKVEPLETALAPFQAWVSGIRREDAPTRDGVPVVQWDEKRSMVKVNPLATWTADDHAAYAAEHGVLVNPLYGPDYPSIGCAPCTRAVGLGEHPRAGRWAGHAKTECGLHS